MKRATWIRETGEVGPGPGVGANEWVGAPQAGGSKAKDGNKHRQISKNIRKGSRILLKDLKCSAGFLA